MAHALPTWAWRALSRQVVAQHGVSQLDEQSHARRRCSRARWRSKHAGCCFDIDIITAGGRVVRQLVASGRVCCWSGAVQCGGSWSHTLPRAVDEPVRPVLDAPLSLARVAAFGLSVRDRLWNVSSAMYEVGYGWRDRGMPNRPSNVAVSALCCLRIQVC